MYIKLLLGVGGKLACLFVCEYICFYIHTYTHTCILYLGIEIQELIQWMFLKHKTEDFIFGSRSEVASF